MLFSPFSKRGCVGVKSEVKNGCQFMNATKKMDKKNNNTRSMSLCSFVTSSFIFCPPCLWACHFRFVLLFFFCSSSVSAPLHNIFLSPPPFLMLLCFSRPISPLSLLFFALSDMSQDSSDEESEEEEDFAQVQFGSRYTTAQCVLTCVCLFVCKLVHGWAFCMFQRAQQAYH